MSKILLPKVVSIIQETGNFLVRAQPRVREIRGGPGKDFLTDADLKANSLLCQGLRGIHSGIPIYSEEGEQKAIGGGPCWILDPLDGSINFSRQDVFWGISVAFVNKGKVQLGVIYLPKLRMLAGVTREGQIITQRVELGVSSETNLSRAQVWTDWSKSKPDATVSFFSKLGQISRYPQVRLCSSATFLWVASGRIEAYVEPGVALEDWAAGSLIVEQAGGRVTDRHRRPLTLSSDSIVASNGFIHGALIKGIQDIS